MKLADLHCDTVTRIYNTNTNLETSNGHIRLDLMNGFDTYIQLTAIFTDPSIDEGLCFDEYERFKVNAFKEAERCGIPYVKSGEELKEAVDKGEKRIFILSIEDSRMLHNDISKLDTIRADGVRVMSPMWGGRTCMGGSHQTHEGLTDFGKDAVMRMCELNIIPDIAHASFETADDVMDICEKMKTVPVATHMNSYTLCPVSRNLTDDRYKRLVNLGGIVGVSLCPPHLNKKEKATAEDVIKHISHYISLCGEDNVCMGCDLDGTDLPIGFDNLSSLEYLYSELKKSGYNEKVADKIFFDNSYNWLKANIK